MNYWIALQTLKKKESTKMELFGPFNELSEKEENGFIDMQHIKLNHMQRSLLTHVLKLQKQQFHNNYSA